MKIFAFADLHLDSAFSAYAENERAERKELLLRVFGKICNECREKKADVLLICGDLFDVPEPSPACFEFVSSELSTLGIDVIIAPGNHDYHIPGGVYDKMPENVYVFRENCITSKVIEKYDLSIDGYAFTSDSHTGFPRDNFGNNRKGYTNILMAHTDIFNPSAGYAYINPEYFSSGNYIYAFLGHVHTDTEVRKIGNCRYAYSGIPQGRSIDEPICGGLREVEIIDGKVISDALVPFDEWKNLIYEVSLDGCTSDTESIRRIVSELSICGMEALDVVRIILTGEHGFYYIPDEGFILKQVKKIFREVNFSLKNNSAAEINREQLLADPSVLGVLYRTLFENSEYTEKYTEDQRIRAFRLALSAMRGDQLNYENI